MTRLDSIVKWIQFNDLNFTQKERFNEQSVNHRWGCN
ncbi:hypothetical protein V144x_24970 [Gimesia aquarii]|uniref:Uncharacterized protein n=1 Tax=Gimesia aquarii TaxID=2527964 RepID=A0A517VVJ2_9PLAN|nr:hypothetical protein V144x_24970 [Gimesia aquarii]